jgi:biopolymer transport protein ExbD
MKAHYLHHLSLLFIILLLFFMSSKRKSSVVKSGPQIKISHSTDSETPVAQIRNITIHPGPSGHLTQNVSHIPQSEMFSNLPNLLSIKDDNDDELDINVDNDTVHCQGSSVLKLAAQCRAHEA